MTLQTFWTIPKPSSSGSQWFTAAATQDFTKIGIHNPPTILGSKSRSFYSDQIAGWTVTGGWALPLCNQVDTEIPSLSGSSSRCLGALPSCTWFDDGSDKKCRTNTTIAFWISEDFRCDLWGFPRSKNGIPPFFLSHSGPLFRRRVSPDVPSSFPSTFSSNAVVRFWKACRGGGFPLSWGVPNRPWESLLRIYRNVVFQCLPTSLLAGSILIWGVIGSPAVTLC
jgi:hypothetical protein